MHASFIVILLLKYKYFRSEVVDTLCLPPMAPFTFLGVRRGFLLEREFSDRPWSHTYRTRMGSTSPR